MEQFHYELMVPPFEKYDFSKYSKKETKIYFDWYISQSEKRISQIKDYCDATSIHKLFFDQKPSSLIPIWEWFEGHIFIQEKTEDEINSELQGRPLWMQEEIKKNNWKLSSLTCALAIDLSFYFADVFMKNNVSIKWGYFTSPKNLESVNRPVLIGFIKKLYLDPRVIVLTSCTRSVCEHQSTRLYDLYTTWSKFVEV